MWQQWINGLLGLWLMIVPFLAMTQQSFMWVVMITGLIVAILAFWGAGRENSTAHHDQRMAMGSR